MKGGPKKRGKVERLSDWTIAVVRVGGKAAHRSEKRKRVHAASRASGPVGSR